MSVVVSEIAGGYQTIQKLLIIVLAKLSGQSSKIPFLFGAQMDAS